MKQAFTFEAARPANDPDSDNADALKRGIAFTVLALNKCEQDDKEKQDKNEKPDKVGFADFMYEYIRPRSVEELFDLVADLQALVESSELFITAVATMALTKVGRGGEAPSAAEVRQRHRDRTGKELGDV